MRKWLLGAMGIIALDQASKLAITASFRLGDRLSVIPGLFDLTLAYNPGAAFSFLADAGGWQRHFFTVLALIVSLSIVAMLKRHLTEPRFCLQLTLILGGALGNVIDRIAYGHVIDFVLMYYRDWYYPAFNIADSAICIGVGLMLLDGILERKKKDA